VSPPEENFPLKKINSEEKHPSLSEEKITLKEKITLRS
jgi:hypothetical protein